MEETDQIALAEPRGGRANPQLPKRSTSPPPRHHTDLLLCPRVLLSAVACFASDEGKSFFSLHPHPLGASEGTSSQRSASRVHFALDLAASPTLALNTYCRCHGSGPILISIVR